MTAALDAAIEAAVAARNRLATRPVRETALALAEAARRWRDDATLPDALATASESTPAMVRAVLPLVAEAIDAEDLVELHAREGGAQPPVLVVSVLASNIPALAVPAIVLASLAGAAVVVKSGRADTGSAPAFHRALAAVDPTLAATVVPTYWPGGLTDLEDVVFARADVVTVTGADPTVGAVARRYGGKVLAYGDRASFAVVPDTSSDAEILGLAWDVARYEQRGCLSPHTVLTPGDPHALADRLATSLARVAREVPPPSLAVPRSAARRLALEEARFAGATVLESEAGTVLVDATAPPRASPFIGHRTIRIVPIPAAPHVADAFAPGSVECVGIAGGVPLDVEALRRRGVARICPVGRMQRPRIDWPRGQRPALASLFRACGDPRIQVET